MEDGERGKKDDKSNIAGKAQEVYTPRCMAGYPKDILKKYSYICFTQNILFVSNTKPRGDRHHEIHGAFFL